RAHRRAWRVRLAQCRPRRATTAGRSGRPSTLVSGGTTMPVSMRMRSEMPTTLTTSRPWEFLRLTIDDGVALVTLYRPPTNALIGPMIDELVRAFDAFTDDAAVRAVVVTGGVRNGFSSGGDLGALFGDTIRAAGETARRELFERMQRAFEYIEAFP